MNAMARRHPPRSARPGSESVPHPSLHSMSLRIAFAGTPAFALPPLRAIHGAHALVGVLTQPDRPAGRGRELAASPVKMAAMAMQLPVVQPAGLRSDPQLLATTLAQLSNWRVDVLVVVAYGLILHARCCSSRDWVASISMLRCCRAGAARRRYSAPFLREMQRPASASCRWMKASTLARCLRVSALPSALKPRPRSCMTSWLKLAQGRSCWRSRILQPAHRGPLHSRPRA